jgi:tight adherence protein B
MLLATSLTFFFIIFLLASITTALLYLAFQKMRTEEIEALQIQNEEGPPASAGETGLTGELSPLLRSDRLSTITFLDSILARFDIGALLQTRLEQAQVDWSVGRLTSMMLLMGIIALAALLEFFPAWFSLLGAGGVMLIPYFYLTHRRDKRFRLFRENFPDALDSLSRALRAGYPLSAAMDMIATETAQPVSGELRRTSTEANLGRGWPMALANLGRRVPVLEVNTFIAAVQLHARTGGKLSEVMTNLAEQMREGLSLQGEVRSMAAHGKLTGIILTILPVGIAAMMMVVSPDYMSVLYHHPLGKTLIGAAIGCLVLAQVIIRKIVDIQV